MEEKRERRRRDLRRMKDRARRYARIRGWKDPKLAEQSANYLAICSCSGCGNQRHNPWATGEERLTMQERRFLSEQVE